MGEERKKSISAERRGPTLIALASCLLFQVTADSSGQQPATSTLHVTSRLVVLDVRVINSKGHFVPGLDKSQFGIFEDKVEQRIRNFEGPEFHTVPASKVPLVQDMADLAKIGNAPVNVLVLDELNTPFSQMARAQDALRHFLQAQPEVLPVPTLLLVSGDSGVTVLHDFTQSRAELLAGLNGHKTDFQPQALNNQLAGGTMAAQEGFAKTLGALSQVASSLRGIPGHKNVIWVGTGFDNAYDLTSADQADAQKIEDVLELVTRRMLEARMSLSTLDPAGVDVKQQQEDVIAEATAGGGPSSITNSVQDASFDELAESTGGTVVHGRNDLAKLIAEDTGAAADYYTLTYTPTNSSDASLEYRNIKVVMKDPSLHAITRTSYYAGPVEEPPVNPGDAKAQTREFNYDLLSAGGSRLVYTGLHVEAVPAGGGYKVLVHAENLQWNAQNDETRTAGLTIVGVAFNKKDKVLVQQAKEFKERIKGTDQINGRQVEFNFPLAVPQGAKRVRFVVRDAATGNIGSVDIQR